LMGFGGDPIGSRAISHVLQLCLLEMSAHMLAYRGNQRTFKYYEQFFAPSFPGTFHLTPR
jgi:hypothetical protein